MRQHRCLRCLHNLEDHESHGGACGHEIYTETCSTDDVFGTVSITEDVTLCSCPYLLLGA